MVLSIESLNFYAESYTCVDWFGSLVPRDDYQKSWVKAVQFARMASDVLLISESMQYAADFVQ